MKPTQLIQRAEGVAIAAYEAGDPHGPPILFLHGIGFSSEVFARQMASPRLAGGRLVAVDLRGHGRSGFSEKDAAAVGDGRVLADDVAAVVEELDLHDLTVVAWSYSGLVLGHYLSAHGAGAVSRINLVAGALRAGPTTLSDFGTDAAPEGLWATDAEARNAGATRFVAAGAGERPFSPDDSAWLEDIVLQSDPAIVLGLLQCTTDYDSLLTSIDVDLLISHGTADRINLPVMSERVSALLPSANLSWYDGVGHLPFLEESERFDDELTRLVWG